MKDHTYYTDAFLNACLENHVAIRLTAHPFVPLRDEELEEAPVPPTSHPAFSIDFGLNPE